MCYKKDRIYEEEFEDTKGVIRIRKSMKERQQNGQKKKNKRTNNDLQNIRIKDRVTRTLQNTGGELRFSGRIRSACSTSDTRRVNLFTNPVLSHE
jgi:hypothetical protein